MFHITFVQIGVFDWLSGRQKRVNFRKNVLKSSSQETIWRMKPKLGILAKTLPSTKFMFFISVR